MVALVLVVVALALLWTVGSVVLRLVAWVTVATILFSLVIGEDVPPVAPAIAAGCWLGAEVLFRLRRGVWRSRLLATVSGRGAAPLVAVE